MTDKPITDLAYLRALAEESRTTPLRCGPDLLAAGSVFSLASFICAALLASGNRTGLQLDGVWLAAIVIFMVILRLMAHMRSSTGSKALMNKVVAQLWGAVGWGCAALFVACVLLDWRTHSDLIWSLMPSAIFVLYGLGWLTTATVARRPAIGMFGRAALVAAIIAAWLPDGSWGFIATGILIALLLLVPGVWLTLSQDNQHG